MIRLLNRLTMVAACLFIGTSHANEWPDDPATPAGEPVEGATDWDLSAFRHIRPVLEAMAAASDGQALNKSLQVVFWDQVLAQQLNSKTEHGPTLRWVEKTEDGLLIEASLGEVEDRGLNLQIPVRFHLRLDAALRAEAMRAYRDRLLSVALTAQVTSVSQGEDSRLVLTSHDAVAILRRSGIAISGELPTELQWGTPEHRLIEASAVPTSELVIEGENFDGVRVFADWEPAETGWYGRTIKQAHKTLTYSEDTVVVAHNVALGQPLTKTLATPLAPGRYEVLLDVSYHRTRLDDNIMTVSLGSEAHRFSWFLPPHYYGVGEEKGFIRGPIFTLKEPASTISLTPLQLGGGSLGEIPTFQERFIIIDLVLIRSL